MGLFNAARETQLKHADCNEFKLNRASKIIN